MRRVEELADPGHDGDRDVEPVDAELHREGDRGDEHRAAQVRDPHDALAVVAVDEHAGDQADDEGRHGGRHQHQADAQRASGQAEDVDARHQRRERVAERRNQLGTPQKREGTLPEYREHRG